MFFHLGRSRTVVAAREYSPVFLEQLLSLGYVYLASGWRRSPTFTHPHGPVERRDRQYETLGNRFRDHRSHDLASLPHHFSSEYCVLLNTRGLAYAGRSSGFELHLFSRHSRKDASGVC